MFIKLLSVVPFDITPEINAVGSNKDIDLMLSLNISTIFNNFRLKILNAL